MPHKAVLVREVLKHLRVQPKDVVLDGTLGHAGHAQEILKQLGPQGRLIGLDQDASGLERAKKTLQDNPQCTLRHANFENADQVLEELNIEAVNAVLIDIGTSSDQLEDASRGFSFELDGPLDMRMNQEAEVDARALIHALSERELADVIWRYGEERRSRQFAEAICRWRDEKPLETTADLVAAVEEGLPRGMRFKKGQRPSWARRHPATKVFQALRIAINDELGVLERALPKLWGLLAKDGRFAVISFHSLEDRIVKRYFRGLKDAGEGELLVKRPLIASEEEMKENPRSRSAKLRVIRKRV